MHASSIMYRNQKKKKNNTTPAKPHGQEKDQLQTQVLWDVLLPDAIKFIFAGPVLDNEVKKIQ